VSRDVVAKSRGLSRWALRLTLLVAACGCSSTKEWPVYRLYEGNTRPLNEIAVVLTRWGVHIEKMDGSLPIEDLPESYEYTIEYHILPGRHDITASYKRTGFERIESGDPITITPDLSAGTVYVLWAKTPIRYVYGGSRDYGVWSLDLLTKGPIDKAACSTTFDPPKPTGDLLSDLEPLRTIYVPPVHWVELRKLHCPEKVVGQDQ
jgi:hypothetical protein